MTAPLPVAVLISGRGSNLVALMRARDSGRLPVEFRLVLSNRADATGLEHARAGGIETATLDHRDHPDRDAYDRALADRIDASGAELVILAGFMRILSAGFTERFSGRLINIHPSLLPAYRGLHTHRRALADGVREHGASVHFVTAELDGGPVIAQARVPVLAGDDEEALAARVLVQEHRLYPAAVSLLARGRVALSPEGRVQYDGRDRETPLCLDRDIEWPA